MGRVTTAVKLENFGDLWDVHKGRLSPDEVQAVDVEDALVDSGCTTVGLPKRYLDQLGLLPVGKKQVRAAIGTGIATVYSAVRLTIQDRSCTSDVFEVADDVPVLIGPIPLEALDFVIDPRGQRIIANPAHDGEHIIEAY